MMDNYGFQYVYKDPNMVGRSMDGIQNKDGDTGPPRHEVDSWPRWTDRNTAKRGGTDDSQYNGWINEWSNNGGWSGSKWWQWETHEINDTSRYNESATRKR